MDTTTEIKHIDHLGLVAAVCDEAGIVDLINEYVGKAGCKVSVGHAVKAMVFNALGFTARALYLTPMFFTHRPVQLVLRCFVNHPGPGDAKRDQRPLRDDRPEHLHRFR